MSFLFFIKEKLAAGIYADDILSVKITTGVSKNTGFSGCFFSVAWIALSHNTDKIKMGKSLPLPPRYLEHFSKYHPCVDVVSPVNEMAALVENNVSGKIM